MNKSPVVLSKDVPHKSAIRFRELQRPHLINIEDEWLDRDPETGAYRSISDFDIEAEVAGFLIETKAAINEEIDEGGKKAVRQRLVPFNPKKSHISEVCQALKHLCHRPRGEWQAQWLDGRASPSPRDIIACRSGLLDTRTMTLYGHTPDFFTRSSLPIDYVPYDERDPFAEHPHEFLRFLKEAMAKRQYFIDLIQEVMGYLLSPDADLEAVFYLLGESRGGKGTLIKIIKALGGDNVATPAIRDFASPYWAHPLREKSIGIVTDMTLSDRQAVRQAASNINVVSGRDPVDMQRKYKEPITAYTLPTRIMMAGNAIPDFGDHAVALVNRLVMILFDVSFVGREDRTLADRIIAKELPLIFGWALRGLLRLRERGHFLEPEESKARKREIVGVANPVRTFVEDRCVIDKNAQVAKAQLYAEYQVWCGTNGVKHVLAQKDFAQRLYDEVPAARGSRPRVEGGRVQCYEGIRLASKPMVPSDFKAIDFEETIDGFLDLGYSPADALDAARLHAREMEQDIA
jgi:putative DNA primase/helicase